MSIAEIEPVHADRKDKEALVNRLHRIEGQARGIEKMVEDDRCYADILTQVGAANSALDSLALELLDNHVRHCLADAIASSGDEDNAREKTEELLAAVQRYSRTR